MHSRQPTFLDAYLVPCRKEYYASHWGRKNRFLKRPEVGMSLKPAGLFAAIAAWALIMVNPSFGQVRFGNNVRIGGHDVSNQRFDRKRRGEFHIYNAAPPTPGCRWRSNRDGSSTKVCHLQRKLR
jgi:hypothetical protein